MTVNKESTVCFSGYRPHKFDFQLSGDEYDLFTKRLHSEIAKAIERGYDTFLVGMAPSYDLIAAELVVLARRAYSEMAIKLVCALPYANFKDSKHFNVEWRERYDSVIAQAAEIINVTEKDDWSNGCYDLRNKFMVDNSSLLICYSTGKSGGTKNTIKCATDNGIKVVNIAELS